MPRSFFVCATRATPDPPLPLSTHSFSSVMIIIYPIGIPLLYAFLLLRERQELGTPTLSELARVRSNSRTAVQQAAADEESWDRMKHGHLL